MIVDHAKVPVEGRITDKYTLEPLQMRSPIFWKFPGQLKIHLGLGPATQYVIPCEA